MAREDTAGLTPADGRRFGLVVGTAFLALAAVGWWRGHSAVLYGAGALGVLLVAAGLAVPTRLGPVQRAWHGLAEAISRVTTPVVLTVIYFLVLTPVGVLRRWIGGDPLTHGDRESGYWVRRDETPRTEMRNQF